MAVATARPAPDAAEVSGAAGGWRHRARTVWAATMALLLGLLFTGLTGLTVALWATDPAYTETNPVMDLAFFALGGILVTVGFASQVTARHIAGLQQVLLALLVLAAAGLLGGRVEPFAGGLVLLAAAVPLVVLHPDRRRLLRARAGVSRPLVALAAAAAAPAILYASAMLDRARAAGPSCFLGQCAEGDRFAEAAALALAVVLAALLASLRTRGSLLPAWCAGLAALILGAASLALPGQPGALSVPWAVAAELWGGAVIVTAHTQGRAARGPAMNPQGR